MKNALMGLIVTVTLAVASVTAYHVEPRTAAMSGKVSGDPQNGGVSQTVVVCWDSLERIEIFAGAKGNGGVYRAGVWLDGAEVMWSWGDRVADHAWIKFEDWNTQVAFTKGKTVNIRPCSDSGA